MDTGDAAARTAEASGSQEPAALLALKEKAAAGNQTAGTSNGSSPCPSDSTDNTEKPSAANSEAPNGNGESKAMAIADQPSPAAQQGVHVHAIPSRPYVAPAGLSEHGQKIAKELKSVLEGPADRVVETLLDTPFCESTGENSRRVDTRVMFALHQLLQETLKANPESTVEVFKRMLAIKIMLKRPEDAAFASMQHPISLLLINKEERKACLVRTCICSADLRLVHPLLCTRLQVVSGFLTLLHVSRLGVNCGPAVSCQGTGTAAQSHPEL